MHKFIAPESLASAFVSTTFSYAAPFIPTGKVIMTQYKSYAKEGSFSQFQIAVPDQTKKIRRQTDKTLAGMNKAAEQFRRDSAAIYLEAQKFVQGQEELNRETNYKLENKERDSYRKALAT